MFVGIGHRHDIGQVRARGPGRPRRGGRHVSAGPFRGRGPAGPSRTRSIGGPPCARTLDALAAAEPRRIASVTGIGLSGQMHGATLLDDADAVLRPAILWNDGRAAAECPEIEAACPEARAITGNIAMPGFTAPKLAWVRKHEPEIFAKLRRVLLPKDYVRLKLTGDHATDMSDAAGTYWLDVGGRRWSDALLAATPPRPFADAGALRGHGADRAASRPVAGPGGAWIRRPSWAGGGGDNAASACGIGAVRPNASFLSLGTSGGPLRVQRALLAQHGRRGARLLPRPARHLAPDGRHPVGDGQPQLVRPAARNAGPGADGGPRRDGRAAFPGPVHALPVRRAGHRTTMRARAAVSSASTRRAPATT